MVTVHLKGEILLNVDYSSKKKCNVWHIKAAP